MGFVFKVGERGLGHYKDTPPVFSLASLLGYAATEAAPLQPCLDQLVPTADQSGQAKYAEALLAR